MSGPGAPVEVVTLGEVMALMLAEGGSALGQAARFDLSVAGAEGNVAIGLSRLGHAVALWTCVGDDALGDVVLRTLRGEGVDVGRARRIADRPTGLLVRDAPPALPVTVSYYRSGSAGTALAPQDVVPELIAGASLLHLTGITAMLSDSSHDAALAAVAAAKAHGVTVSVDPNLRLRLGSAEQWQERLDPLLRAADIVLTGRDELELLSGGDDPRWLIERGAHTVVVKDGAAGAYETDGETELRVAARSVPLVDAVGAGDAFAAGGCPAGCAASPGNGGWTRRRWWRPAWSPHAATSPACPTAAVRDALLGGGPDVRR
jgi:2-dehydro-3-deoxygluconokinase